MRLLIAAGFLVCVGVLAFFHEWLALKIIGTPPSERKRETDLLFPDEGPVIHDHTSAAMDALQELRYKQGADGKLTVHMPKHSGNAKQRRQARRALKRKDK